MITDFTPRLYQQTILATAASYNSLVVLPTGLGKTAIAFMLTAQRLRLYPHSKIFMLAPTKPLCEQHQASFQKHLDISNEKIVVFTGSIKPEVRAELFKTARIIISTPQGLENDLINRKVVFDDVSLLILDEAHHATGEYSYVWVCKQYVKYAKHLRILALTASPGSDIEKIHEVCANLHIEKVEVRTGEDSDVKPYVQDTNIEWVGVVFPKEYKGIHTSLTRLVKARVSQLISLNATIRGKPTKSQLLKLQGILRSRLSKGEPDYDAMKALSVIAQCVKIEHALELLECQGILPLFSYLKRLEEEAPKTKVKAVKAIVQDPHFRAALVLAQEVIAQHIEYPKKRELLKRVKASLERSPNTKLIIFANLRDTAQDLSHSFTDRAISNKLFVGQTKKNGVGLTQREQKSILEDFRAGRFSVLIATSVGEEGLDIPSVEHVFFYEPTPSAIRSIQRRGRTGRNKEGKVTIFFTKGTRDEAYRWASHHKEKRMYQLLHNIKKSFEAKGPQKVEFNTAQTLGNKTLTSFTTKEEKKDAPTLILADHREKNNKIVKELLELDVSVRLEQLTSADYVLSGVVGVELKKVGDFVSSLLDGRLLNQIQALKKNFEKSVMIIEGEQNIFSARNIHANAIRGALASIVLGHGVPVLYTKDEKDTAALLLVMAKREQHKGATYSLHCTKPLSLKNQQEFIVSAFPSIGRSMAKILLEHFGSIKALVNATEDELRSVKGVGVTIAKNLVNVFGSKYARK